LGDVNHRIDRLTEKLAQRKEEVMHLKAELDAVAHVRDEAKVAVDRLSSVTAELNGARAGLDEITTKLEQTTAHRDRVIRELDALTNESRASAERMAEIAGERDRTQQELNAAEKR
jgi:chromosome segregation ATPase